VLTGVIGAHLLYAAALIPVASENIRMAAAFSIDESDILFQIQHLFRDGITNPPSFTYGGMLYYPVTLLLHLWNVVAEVDGQAVALATRWMCALAGTGCLVLTYRLGHVVFDRVTGLVGALLLAVSPIFLRWSVEGHPDLLQLFWILGALLFCIGKSGSDLRGILGATCCAGLAFGTKYGGVFLLPVIALSLVMPGQGSLRDVVAQLRRPRTWTTLVVSGVVFAGVFAATNPWSVIRLDAFVDVMADYKEWMQFGHTRREGGSGFVWIELLYGALGPIHILMLICLVGAGILKVLDRRPIPRDRVLLAAWILLFVLYLMVQVGLRRERHLLPVLPVMLIFIAAGYRSLLQRLSTTRSAPALALAAVLFSFGQIAESSALFNAKRFQLESRVDDIDMGRWLAESIPPRTSIVYDAYAYIPPAFQRVWRSTGTT